MTKSARTQTKTTALSPSGGSLDPALAMPGSDPSGQLRIQGVNLFLADVADDKD